MQNLLPTVLLKAWPSLSTSLIRLSSLIRLFFWSISVLLFNHSIFVINSLWYNRQQLSKRFVCTTLTGYTSTESLNHQDWGESVWANSVDPDQTAPKRNSLIRIYTICHTATMFMKLIFRKIPSYWLTHCVITVGSGMCVRRHFFFFFFATCFYNDRLAFLSLFDRYETVCMPSSS